jgi:hypothetical protein
VLPLDSLSSLPLSFFLLELCLLGGRLIIYLLSKNIGEHEKLHHAEPKWSFWLMHMFAEPKTNSSNTPIPLRIRILHGLRHYCALQQAPHPSPQNRRRVPALPISTLSLSSPQLSACARGCSRAPGVIDCMRSGMGSVAGNGDGYGEERECVGRAF